MADAPTAEGAEAFARYWIDVLNVAFATLDPGQLQAMSEPTCKTCSNYAGSLRASARDGEVYEGGRYRVLSVVSAPVAGRSARVLLTYSTPKLVVRNRAGDVIDTVPRSKRSTLVIDLLRRDEGWRVKEAARYADSD